MGLDKESNLTSPYPLLRAHWAYKTEIYKSPCKNPSIIMPLALFWQTVLDNGVVEEAEERWRQ